eukprot:TRINITY_DN31204_c0_g1_i1.p1 TRINITY_DN31204_c0_g1~~TRINITY_DN31204_c0_g1_i1.p1  ORF type:complete len:266 (+),score=34.84 TRINITY_DN31204_c0_g1_i1:103-900(+)
MSAELAKEPVPAEKNRADGNVVVPETKPSYIRGNSMNSTVAAAGDAEADEDPSEAEVWIHIYHTDATTGFLNWAFLKSMEMPICHAGVEVFGSEWSFQYYEDTWDDPSISGVVRSEPKSMPQFDYQESLCLGATPLRKDAVFFLLEQLYDEWPANSYHLTHHNCINFVECLVSKLKTPKPLPEWITGILVASNNSAVADGIAGYGWSWARWWMEYKHRPVEDDDEPSPTPSEDKQQRATSAGCVRPTGFFALETCTGSTATNTKK